MKKLFAAALALICVLGLVGCSPMDNVPTLESIKEYSAEDFNEHFKGVNREGLIEVWGDPAGNLTEENADMWDIDDESMVVIYWKDNGKFESAGISIKENINNADSEKASSIDRTSDAENQADISGIELSGEDVEFEVGKNADGVQITESGMITNTTKITVSANKISNGTEIALFLYNADSPDTPILYATLTKEDHSVDFENLTSRFAYKVGAEIKTANEDILLTITD